MQLITTHVILPSFFLTAAFAFPLNPLPHANRVIHKRAAYSVVAVDGGAAAATISTPNAVLPPAATIVQTVDDTITITAAATPPPPSLETVIATRVVTDSEPVQTVKIIVTHDVTITTSLPSGMKYTIVNDVSSPTVITASILPILSTSAISVAASSGPLSAILSSTNLPSTTSTFIKSSSSIPSSATPTTITSSSTTLSSSPPSSITSTANTSILITSFRPSSASTTMTASTLSRSSIPFSETVIPEEKAWSPPTSLIAFLSSSVSSISSQSIMKPTSTSETYDDGMWHTTYHTWDPTSTIPSSVQTISSRIP